MKQLFNIALLTICLLLSNNSEAQIFKKIKKGIKDKVENAKKDKDKEEKEKEENVETKEDAPFDLESMMGNMMKPVNTEDSYTFDVTATIEMIEYGKKDNKTIVTQGYGEDVLLTEMEGQTGAMIYDMKNKAIILLDEKKKEAQALSMDMMNLANVNNHQGENPMIDVRKSGKKRIINDYSCEEYIISHDDGRMEAWFAAEVPFSFEDYLMSFNKLFNHLADDRFPSDKGYVMEMHIYDDKGTKTSEMKVISFSEDGLKTDMSKYNMKKMF